MDDLAWLFTNHPLLILAMGTALILYTRHKFTNLN